MNTEELIKKYNTNGPRYTSYPPVPFWNKSVDQKTWIRSIENQLQLNPSLDLYVHIPFCESLCYYCGCHRSITKNHGVEERLVNGLLEEWELYKDKIQTHFEINTIHLGGGTPTFLSPKNLSNLLENLIKKKSTQFEGSIEIDPRTCQIDHLKVLKEFGFRKISLGIQDFDLEVQRAINRYQSFDLVRSIVEKARDLGIQSINFDLIYGLPKQTKKSIDETFKKVTLLSPNTIAFYSYAHLPEKIKNQKLIKSEDIPTGHTKRELYETGKDHLKKMGFIEIGMDHFAKKHSFLAKALTEKKLHRNFMGYTDKKTDLLIGLGPSAISSSKTSFRQNNKNLNEYLESISETSFPHNNGHDCSHLDLVIQKIIMEVLCLHEISLEDIEKLPFKKEIKEKINEFQNDQLITLDHNRMNLTESGKMFSRNIAMVFDPYLREEKLKLFSATI